MPYLPSRGHILILADSVNCVTNASAVNTLNVNPQGINTHRVVPRYQIPRRFVGSANLSLHPLHIGRGVVRVDAFFSSFIRAERKERAASIKQSLL
jgi:hypothetical protein